SPFYLFAFKVAFVKMDAIGIGISISVEYSAVSGHPRVSLLFQQVEQFITHRDHLLLIAFSERQVDHAIRIFSEIVHLFQWPFTEGPSPVLTVIRPVNRIEHYRFGGSAVAVEVARFRITARP